MNILSNFHEYNLFKKHIKLVKYRKTPLIVPEVDHFSNAWFRDHAHAHKPDSNFPLVTLIGYGRTHQNGQKLKGRCTTLNALERKGHDVRKNGHRMWWDGHVTKKVSVLNIDLTFMWDPPDPGQIWHQSYIYFRLLPSLSLLKRGIPV